MTIKLAINGYGRIGRLVHRALIDRSDDDLQLVCINDPGPASINAHLLKYDSVHGTLPNAISGGESIMHVDGQNIPMYHTRNIMELDWKKHDVDIVLECTGAFCKNRASMAHIDYGGAKKVLVSAPADPVDATIVYGVNEGDLQKDHRLVSNASCTTNCLAPVIRALYETIGVKNGYMSTVHSYTGDQPTIDRNHSDLRRARAAAISMIPTSTGAATAVTKVIPAMKGRLAGSAIRVPTPNVSLVDFTFTSEKPTDIDALNQIFTDYAAGTLKDILDVSDLPLVSSDYNHNAHSAIIDLAETSVLDGHFCRILAWYDNEWGFSHRMLDVAKKMMFK